MIWSPRRDHLARRGGARPAHFGYVKKALNAATQVDEGAEVEHRDHAARQHRARHDRLADGRRIRLLFLLEQLPPRDDDGLAAVLVLDDAERVGLADVHRGVDGAGDVDLRERTEGTLARDAHLVASLDGALDLAFHGEPGLERVLQLALRRGIAHALARQRDAATGRDDDGLNAIADRHLDVAVVVLELGKVDLRLALSSDADEGHVRTERDDGPLDCLAPLESTRFEGRLEHRREIFFLLAHCRSIRSDTPAIVRVKVRQCSPRGRTVRGRRGDNR